MIWTAWLKYVQQVFGADCVRYTEPVRPTVSRVALCGGAGGFLLDKAVEQGAQLYVTADNLLDGAYQNHLSRLKYCDINNVTGRQGVYNMGRNIVFKVIIPIEL